MPETNLNLPKGALAAIVSEDWYLASQIFAREAARYLWGDYKKYASMVKALEKEFTRLTGRDPWAGVSDQDKRVYREKIAYYARRLQPKYLFDDVRLIGKKAQSLKYFIVPGHKPARAARWELAWSDKCVELNSLQARQAEEQLERKAAELFQNQLVAKTHLPDWVSKSKAEIEMLVKNNYQKNTKEIFRIQQKVAFHGYLITVNPNDNTVSVIHKEK